MPYEQRDDSALLKKVGFKTTGPPAWIWHASKAAALNKLRKLEPKSGITITELALEKYKLLDSQEQTKLELKKKFKRLQESALQFQFEEYFDEELQIVCFVVKPAETPFVGGYVPPKPPDKRCLGCDDPMYFPFDDRAYCIWCEKTENSA